MSLVTCISSNGAVSGYFCRSTLKLYDHQLNNTEILYLHVPIFMVSFTILKLGVNVKAVLRSLNKAFLPTLYISVMFQATLNLSAYLINHCLAV